MSMSRPIEPPALLGRFRPLEIALTVLSNWSGLIGIVLLWEFAGRVANLILLPPFSRVMARLFDLIVTGEITPHLVASLGSLALGFMIALVLGLALGFAMGVSKWVNTALDVYVNAMLFTPGLIFAPILFAIFGLSYWTRVGVVVIYAAFIIIINTAAAVRNVDRPLLEMAASYGASRVTTLRRIVLPDAFPLILAGLRMGMGRAVKGMVNGEIFIALVGIGGMVSGFGKRFDFVSVWALSVFIMILAVAINRGVSHLERRMTSWVE